MPKADNKLKRSKRAHSRDEGSSLRRLVAEQESQIEALTMTVAAQRGAVDEFVANVNHELRTPLNGVLGMIGLLLDTPLTAEQQEYAQAVRYSARMLHALLNEILDFSNAADGRYQAETGDFDLVETVQDAADMISAEAAAKDVEVACLIRPGVPLIARGDASRIRQVLGQLLSNALKFTDSGHIFIEMSALPEKDRRVTVRFCVQDTGIGIPADRLDAVFEPFKQIDGTSTRRFGGAGLGLAVVKVLVKRMDGQVGVDSELGQGSSFWFEIPLEARARPSRIPGDPPDLVGHVVIGLLHSPVGRKVLDHYLRLTGAELYLAENLSQVDQLLAATLSRPGPRIVIAELRELEQWAEAPWTETIDQRRNRGVHWIGLVPPNDSALLSEIDASRVLAGFLMRPLRRDDLMRALHRIARGNPTRQLVPLLSSSAPPVAGEKPLRLLVADDNPTTQRIIVRLLEQAGYFAEAVGNGQEVLDTLASTPYGLVLMDATMPVLDGASALHQIRSGQTAGVDPRIPVVVMVTRGQRAARQRALAAGADYCLDKPVTAASLEAVIATVLRSASQQRHRQGDNTPVLQPEWLLLRLDGDHQAAHELLASFLDDVPRLSARLLEAIELLDVDAASRRAEAIKGAALNVGALALAELATAIERAIRGNAFATARSDHDSIEPEIDRLRHAVANWQIVQP